MGKQTHYEFQPRQRLTTDGLNEQDAWTARMTSELKRRWAQSDRVNVSGVVSGLQVNVVVNTMNVLVSGGLAVKYNTLATSPDSQHDWIEIGDGSPVALTLDAGGANPRWDVIEIAANVVDGDADVLDVYDPSIGAAVGTLLAPLKVCTPLVTIRKGTENANPKLPAGLAGVLPLAYVYVAAGAVVLNANRVMACRPLLFSRRGIYRNEPVTDVAVAPYWESINIVGGGLTVEADGLTGLNATAMQGTFPTGGLPFSIPGNTLIAINAAGNFVGGGLPAGNQNVYAYLAPPPYPTGYDADVVAREMFITDYTTPGLDGYVAPGARNCVVVFGSGDPGLSANGAPGGPHVTYSFVHSGIWGNHTQKRSDLIYIGTAFFAIAVPGMIEQHTDGSWVMTKQKCYIDFDGDLPIGAPTDYFVGAGPAGAPMALPGHVRHVKLQFVASLNAGGSLHIQTEDTWTGINGLLVSGAPSFNIHNTTAGTETIGHIVDAMLTESATVKITEAIRDGGGTTANIVVRAYQDPVLEMR